MSFPYKNDGLCPILFGSVIVYAEYMPIFIVLFYTMEYVIKKTYLGLALD